MGKKTFKQKLRISAPLIIALILFAFVIAILFISRSQIKNQAIKREMAALKTSSAEQDLAMEIAINGQYETLETFSVSLASQDSIGLENVITRMAAIIKRSGFEHMSYALPDGSSWTELHQEGNVSDRRYFRLAMTGKRAIERIDKSIYSQNLCFVISVPVVKDDKIVGVVSGVFSEQTVRNYLMPQINKEWTFSAIYDQFGSFILGSVSNLLFPFGSDLFDTLKNADDYSEDAFKSLQNNLATSQSGSYSCTLDGKSYYIEYHPLSISSQPLNGWFSFNLITNDTIDDMISGTVRINNLFYFLIAGVFTVVCILFILQQSKNYQKLQEDNKKLSISERKYHTALQQTQRAIAEYNLTSHILTHHDAFLTSVGFAARIENMPEAFFTEGIVDPDYFDVLRDFYHQLDKGLDTVSCVVHMLQSDGEYHWLRMTGSPILEAGIDPEIAIIAYEDVTNERNKEIAYQRWQQTLDMKDPSTYSLYRGNISKNNALDHIQGDLLDIKFSKDAGNMSDRNKLFAEQCVYPDDRETMINLFDPTKLLADYYRGNRIISMEYRLLQKNNRTRWVLLTIELIQYENSDEIEAFMMHEDIDEQKQIDVKLQENAETDPLTGLLTLPAFAEKANLLMAHAPEGKQIGFVSLEIENFKLIMNEFGGAVCDQLLIDLSDAIRSIMRQGDLACFYGGNQFIINLIDTPYEAVIEKRIRQLREQITNTINSILEVNISFGISIFPRNGKDFVSQYQNMDIALTTAKALGVNQQVFFSPLMHKGSGISLDEQEKTERLGTRSTFKRRMLIVDDSPMNCDMLGEVFTEEFVIETANDGNSALNILSRAGTGISIVLLDLIMPIMDGMTVLKRMHEDIELRNIPVIVVSADNNHNVVLEAIENGAADFISKPVDVQLIRIRVQSAVSKAENDRLRAQNSYLQIQSDEEARYRTVLESTETIVVEYDWGNELFSYDHAISNYLPGTYDKRNLWSILRAEKAASEKAIHDMKELVNNLISSESLARSSMKVQINTNQGENHWFRFSVFKNVEGLQIAHKVLLTFNDINEEELAEIQLRYQAERDGLTGIYNRMTFIRKAAKIISQSPAFTYVLSIIDINNFTYVNDQFGHEEGDKLICAFANHIMKNTARSEGICGRMNADVFASVMRYEPAVLQENIEALQDFLVNYPLPNLTLYCSVGRFVISEPEISVDSMLDRATMALRSVKGQYGNFVGWYSESMRRQMVDEQEIVFSMEKALEEEQFKVYFQPQFDHGTGKVVGAEALVRWLHPEKGLISPGVFIPIFEKNNFISKLDEFVWNRTAELLHKWLKSGHMAVPVSVNISRRDSGDPELCSKLLAIVKKHDIPIDLFRLEITESAFISNEERLITLVNELRSNGFLIELDDFGSGYSSLNTLKELAVDIIKLDMRFFSGKGDMERGGIIVNAIMRMAKWLNLPVIAEGVETNAQADYLLSIDCSLIQGYLYSKPLPVENFEELLRNSDLNPLVTKDVFVTEITGSERFWNPDSPDSLLFNNFIGPAIVFEYKRGTLEILRMNDSCRKILQIPANYRLDEISLSNLEEDQGLIFQSTIEKALQSGLSETTVFRRTVLSTKKVIHLKASMRLMAKSTERSIFFCIFDEDKEGQAPQLPISNN